MSCNCKRTIQPSKKQSNGSKTESTEKNNSDKIYEFYGL